MSIVVGYIPTPLGRAAVRAAAQESFVSGESVLVVNSANGGAGTDKAIATEEDLAQVRSVLEEYGAGYDIRVLPNATDGADSVMDAAVEAGARLIVIGLRRRTPAGKFLFGSTAQRILLEAECAVLAVKGLPND